MYFFCFKNAWFILLLKIQTFLSFSIGNYATGAELRNNTIGNNNKQQTLS